MELDNGDRVEIKESTYLDLCNVCCEYIVHVFKQKDLVLVIKINTKQE